MRETNRNYTIIQCMYMIVMLVELNNNKANVPVGVWKIVYNVLIAQYMVLLYTLHASCESMAMCKTSDGTTPTFFGDTRIKL